MKNSFLVVFSAALSIAFLGLSSCSKSSDGGAPVKPNLNPVIETTQSLAVVQRAGPQQPNNQTTNNQNTDDQNAIVPSLSVGPFIQMASAEKMGPDVRTNELKKLIANPQQCKMGFRDAGPNAPAGTTVTNMTIGGTDCPIQASFHTAFSVAENMSGSVSMKYVFQAKTKDAQNIIGAKEANISGSMNYGISNPDAMNDKTGNTPLSVDGGGNFTGFIETQSYGRVNLTMDVKIAVKINMGNPEKQIPGSTVGSMSETASFHFRDPAMDVTLAKVTSINNDQETVAYSANGAAITAQEYQDVMGTLSGSQNEEHQTPTKPNSFR